jgi:alpha-amylase/alpha-mannosidase (GH57 family)
MIYWAQLLHFYQPPTQVPSVLRKICDESYRPLLQVFEEYPSARVTINFNGVLTDMMMDCGHKDVIDGLKSLA